MKYKLLIIAFILFSLSVSSFAGQLGQFMATNGLNVPRMTNVAVIAMDTLLYTFGGYAYTNVPYPVERATIRPDGTLSSWAIESEQMLSARAAAVGAGANGYVYAIGGEDEYANLTTVERSKVNPNGTLGAWTVISVCTAVFYNSTLVQTSSFLYVIGGTYAGDPYVYRTSLNPDGTLGTWILCTSKLNIGRNSQMLILINTTLYVLDGFYVSGLTKSVEKATLLPDGELSAFTTISNTVSFHAGENCVYDGQYIYVLGGYQYGGPYVSEKAKVYQDGSLGTWEVASQSGGSGAAAIQTVKEAYAVDGGETGAVEYAPIFPTPPPTFSSFPSLKLFTNQSIFHAFNMEDFNTGDISTTYSILSNFLFLSSLDSSSVNQNAYDSPTTGTNIYLADNAYGESTATNEVKYSTYKIYKLPKIGLTPSPYQGEGGGGEVIFDISQYTYNSTGLFIPPSFGNPDALTISDTTLLSATWVGNTVIHITSLQAFSGPVEIDVTASPNATSPFGIDIDKERIQVYTNLLTHSTFSTSNDTSIWMPLELAPGRTTLATQSWISTYTDSAGTQANGVWRFTFANTNSGVKSTPIVSTWIPMSSGQWYTLRMRLVSDTPNNAHQSVLFGFNNYIGTGIQTDVSANVLFGIPTVWSWQETPLLVHSSTTTGYPQFQFKASTTGDIYIDEIQIINSAPTLVDANRGNTRLFYPYGFLTWNQELGTGNSDTVGWGQEIYYGAGSAPGISVSNNSLQLDFSGASSGTGQQGIKWTANNGIQGSGHAFTQEVTPGREVGVRATVTIQSGTFNSLGIILVAAYGVQTSGQQNIGVSPSNLLASAEVGTLVSGTYRTVANAVNPYYQFQFGVRSDQSGILSLSNIDFDQDQDDPNFGDSTLFP